MPAFLCPTCGTQFAPAADPPARCPICNDERQYVPAAGQGWTTLEALRRTHMNAFREEGELLGIGTTPKFGIGQRALLVRTPAGNVLWDCISLLDGATVAVIRALGGLRAVAISHPHYYTAMAEWAAAFEVPVYLHATDREWVMRPDPHLEFWEGDEREIVPGMTMLRLGGHYPGGTVLHWAAGAGGQGALLTGDILQVTADRKFLGFMRSYPNYIPLSAATVRRMAERVRPWQFDAVYGAFWDLLIPSGARAALGASVERHLGWLERDTD